MKAKLTSVLLIFIIGFSSFSFANSYSDIFTDDNKKDQSTENVNIKNIFVKSESKNIQVVLSDGITASSTTFSNQENKIEEANKIKQNIYNINLSDKITVTSSNYDNHNAVQLIKYDSDRKAIMEKIVYNERIKLNDRSIYNKDLQNENNLFTDDISDVSVIYDTTTNQLQLIDSIVNNFDIKKFLSLRYVDTSFELYNFQNEFLKETNVMTNELVNYTGQFVDIKNPIILLLLVPLSGYILLRSEEEKINLNSKKLLSFSFVILLISSSAIAPFSVSSNYWGSAFAEEVTDVSAEVTNISVINSTSEQDVPQEIPDNTQPLDLIDNSTQTNSTISVPDNSTISVPDNSTISVPDNSTISVPDNSTISIPEEILNVTSDEQTIPDVTQPPSDNLTESETINSIPELNITLQLDEQDYLVIENTNSTRDLSSLTLSTWVKPDYSLGSPELTIISKEKTFVLSINNLPSTKTARFSVYDGIKWNTVESSTQINEEWTHLAASFNGSLISIYVNSELESTLVMTRISTLTINGQLTTTTVDTLSSDSDIVVGSYLNTRNGHVQPINQFSGLIDSVQLYDSLLNPLEITGLYSQNLHAFEETAVSVEPVTILTKPTIDTNLQEYIPQSQPSLIERGIDFERYYIGNGQYELRLGKPVWVQTENGFVPWDIKETGNSFKIKNGRIGFEIDKQTGNSKYSDPATQQTIVPNETWIVQKFIDNTWTSIGIEQQSPSIGVTSNQTGVFVTVTKTMQTGQLVILYEIKEGQPLKSTATFTNYGNTDQFRVLQSWQGIDSDEIQDDAGKQKMDKDKSSRISDKKESKFKFMKNGKGLLEHDQSKASDSFAGYDIHSKNKQIDWIFENPATFTLDTGESLVIDPTTAALTAATAAVVGACTNCSTASAAATDDTTYMGGTGNPATRMTAVEGTKLSAILDDTKIPAGATIDKVQVDLLGAVIATGSVTFDAILFTDPTTPTTIGSTITSSSISSVTPTFTTFSFGSSSLADWGSPALTESNVDTTTFGVRILVNTLVTANGAQIDLVTMTITYTPLTVTDTVTASDSLTATLTIARSNTDTVTASDSLTATFVKSASNSDTVTASDSLTATLTIARSNTDTVTASDSLTATLTIARSNTDTVTASDSLTAIIVGTTSNADTVTASDTLTATRVINKSPSDTVTASDSSTIILNLAPTQELVENSQTVVTIDPAKPELVITSNDAALSTITIPSTVTEPKIVYTNVVPVGSTNTVTINNALTINSQTPAAVVTVTMPPAITMSGPTSWNGIVNLPTIKATTSVTIPPQPGVTNTPTLVIEIGFDDTPLTFDKAVRIQFDGKAAERIGYSRAGTFTEITNTCTSDTQKAANDALSAEGDCKINVGSNLVIWTKHFTKFSSFSSSSTSAGGPSGVSSGGHRTGTGPSGTSAGFGGILEPVTPIIPPIDPAAPKIFDVKYQLGNGTKFSASETTNKYVNYQSMSVSAIVDTPTPIKRAELRFIKLGQELNEYTSIVMDIKPLQVSNTTYTISGTIPQRLMEGPAMVYWTHILNEGIKVQDSDRYTIGVKPDYPVSGNLELDIKLYRAAGTTATPNAYFTNEASDPVYGTISLLVDGKTVYTSPEQLFDVGQTAVTLEWKTPNVDQVTTHQIEAKAEFYGKSFETETTISTFPATTTASLLQPHTIEIMADKDGNTVATPSILYASFKDEGDMRYRVIAPDGTCVIGGSEECLVTQSTIGLPSNFKSITVGDQIYRVRYSGPDNLLERFSITSIDPILGKWQVEIDSEDGLIPQAHAMKDAFFKIKYRAQSTPFLP